MNVINLINIEFSPELDQIIVLANAFLDNYNTPLAPSMNGSLLNTDIHNKFTICSDFNSLVNSLSSGIYDFILSNSEIQIPSFKDSNIFSELYKKGSDIVTDKPCNNIFNTT